MDSRKSFPLGMIGILVLSSCFLAFIPTLASEPEYFFTTTISVLTRSPNRRLNRVENVQVIAQELAKIGINTKIALIGLDEWGAYVYHGDRPFPSYTENGPGFDIELIGWIHSVGGIDYGALWLPTSDFGVLKMHFHSASVNNYYGLDNASLDALIELGMNTTDFNQRKEYLRQALEMLVWEIHPATLPYKSEEVFYIQDNINGCDPYQPAAETMYFTDGRSKGHGNRNELVHASRGLNSPWFNFEGFNYAFKVGQLYKTLTTTPLYSGLVELNSTLHYVPGLATTLPYPVAVRNNHTGEISSSNPNTATVWELELRENLWWHEGYGYTMSNPAHRDALRLDADDVVWHYRTFIDPNGPPITSWVRGAYQELFGTNITKAIHKVDETHVQFHLLAPEVANPGNPLIDIFAIFYSVLPQHILDPTFDYGLGPGIRADGSAAPAYADWGSDDFNQGRRTPPYTGPATIGNGPYVLMPGPGDDPSTQTITMTRFEHYYKDNDTSYWQPLVANRPEKYIITQIANKAEAVHALEKGEIDMMDFTYFYNGYSVEYPSWKVIRTKPGIIEVKRFMFGFELINYNMLHGAEDKLANKWVRLAISHMIPRQYLADSNQLGPAQPDFAPFHPMSPYYPESLTPIEYNRTKALEFMKKAGYDISILDTTPVSSGVELLSVFIAMACIGVLTLVNRHKKPRKYSLGGEVT